MGKLYQLLITLLRNSSCPNNILAVYIFIHPNPTEIEMVFRDMTLFVHYTQEVIKGVHNSVVFATAILLTTGGQDLVELWVTMIFTID